MSISLPNGSFIPAPPSSHAQVSAAVTRILHLSNFSAHLKTRDLQMMFKEWEADKGGFRIKWVDDVNALVVFADATVAKRAYLSLLLNPPAAFLPPAQIKPYDRPDAAQIIQSLAARAMGHRSSMSSALTSGQFANLPSSSGSGEPISGLPGHHHRPGSSSISGLSGFAMPSHPTHTSKSSVSMPNHHNQHPPSKPVATLSNGSGNGGGFAGRMGSGHQRTGSASSSWTRNSTSGMGALNFSFPPQRLPTHSESSAGPASRSNSSSGTDDTPIVVMEHAPLRAGANHPGGIPASELKARRESMSADKALKEVQRALASVEAQ